MLNSACCKFKLFLRFDSVSIDFHNVGVKILLICLFVFKFKNFKGKLLRIFIKKNIKYLVQSPIKANIYVIYTNIIIYCLHLYGCSVSFYFFGFGFDMCFISRYKTGS